MVRIGEEYTSWALCERICRESEIKASKNVEHAAGLARLAQQVAMRVPEPEDWRNRVRGYAAAHVANVLRVSGELNVADAVLDDAKCLWRAGSDPVALLDPGRLLDLEASLRRAQRRFEQSLSLLEEALVIGRSPERVLVKKGFTLEVMGDYERAVETLLQAAPQVESAGDPRLLYMMRFNLAVNFTHTGRYDEAAALVGQVREIAASRGDETELIRTLWLEGRIAAGLGRNGEALRLLEEAREKFAALGMGYDVALALLEEAVLLLEEGRTAEVKELASDLVKVFESKGVHREAMAALLLFQEAAEAETATAGLARRPLAFLHRSRHDPGLRFAL